MTVSAKTGAAPAIVIGGFINGLGLVRALAAMNRRVIVITTHPYDMAHHSKYAIAHHHVPDLGRRPERLAALLRRHAKDWFGAVVFPTHDEAVAALSLYHDRLAPWFRMVLPPLACVPFILDKNRMVEAAGAVGIQLPRGYGAAAEPVVLQSDLRYPVVVKPVRAGEFSARFGKKLFVAHSVSDLLSCIRLLGGAGVAGEVFDMIPGPDSRVYAYCVYMDRHGEPLAETMIRKLRQSPPRCGIARVAELTRRIPLLRDPSIELLRHIGFRGFAAVEFKYDERDGSFRFFEINGRSVVYNSLLQKGNLNLVQMAWADYADGSVKRVEPTHWPGVWIHLHADLLRLLQNRHDEQLTVREYAGPYRRPKTFAVWSSRDPKPFRVQWSRTLREAASLVFNRTDRIDLTGISE